MVGFSRTYSSLCPVTALLSLCLKVIISINSIYLLLYFSGLLGKKIQGGQGKVWKAKYNPVPSENIYSFKHLTY
jgi:hypothetical protein